MKRMFVFVFLPVVLFALEPVNLIKNVGFEKDSELWLMRSRPDGGYDSTVINRHDQDSAYIGNYCGSIDTRICPAASLPNYYSERGYLYQVFALPKKLDDLDSLELFHMALFRLESVKISACSYTVQLKFINPSNQTLITGWYTWLAPNLIPADDTPTDKFFHDILGNEGTWYSLRRDLKADLIGKKSLSGDIELDTFLLHGSGVNYSYVWRGQKVFFDGIRLTGYADYDVGVKEILSGDSVREDVYYTPVARIKNFGREDAPEFSVIAEIWNAETRVYYDSLPWSLTSDTEDTVSFADFTPTNAANHTLIVRTVMEPDESDEDDELSKTLYGTGIAEPVTHLDAITLEVRSLTDPLHVTYSLPYTTSGTLTLYDATGRRIERMAVKGSGSVEFESALPSGVYIVRLETEQTTITKKAVMLR
jgi:hypothetical protein